MDTHTHKLTEKVRRALGQDAIDELDALGPDDIDARQVALTLYEAEALGFLEHNAEVKELKEKLALIVGPTREALRAIKLRRAYLVARRDEVGHVASDG